MPLDKSGSYRPRPDSARMHDSQASPQADGDSGEQKGHVELHQMGPGQYKTVHHSADGQMEEKEHSSLHQAHHAMNEHMGEDGCSGENGCEHDDGDDAGQNSDDDSDGDEY